MRKRKWKAYLTWMFHCPRAMNDIVWLLSNITLDWFQIDYQCEWASIEWMNDIHRSLHSWPIIHSSLLLFRVEIIRIFSWTSFRSIDRSVQIKETFASPFISRSSITKDFQHVSEQWIHFNFTIVMLLFLELDRVYYEK